MPLLENDGQGDQLAAETWSVDITIEGDFGPLTIVDAGELVALGNLGLRRGNVVYTKVEDLVDSD